MLNKLHRWAGTQDCHGNRLFLCLRCMKEHSGVVLPEDLRHEDCSEAHFTVEEMLTDARRIIEERRWHVKELRDIAGELMQRVGRLEVENADLRKKLEEIR